MQDINNFKLNLRNDWYVFFGENMEIAFIFRGMYSSGKQTECFRFELLGPSISTSTGDVIYAGTGIFLTNSTTASNFFHYLTACRDVRSGCKYNTCSKHKFFSILNKYDDDGNVIGHRRVKLDDIVKKDSFKVEELPFDDLHRPRVNVDGSCVFNVGGYLIDWMTPSVGTKIISCYREYIHPDELIRLHFLPADRTEEMLRKSGVTMPFDHGFSPRKRK